MTEQSKPRTRKPTTAERLSARALGREEPVEIEVETRSAGQRLAERLGISAAERTVPEGMSAAEYHIRRFRARSGQVGGDSPDVA